jgi:homopolymeric O-antigen transport system ATP-binding protein
MIDTAIAVRNVSKLYRLGERKPYKTVRESLMNALRTSSKNSKQSGNSELWALRDVSFDVERGEVVGIIGRNGAGKSTLLKIVSRITEPTAGRITIHGRVGSLLEVGTGFHPELTGRENILVNGTILGMRRSEVVSRFDEIVAFAEIERFIDTPVKHYSSGMYMRLAFAVAAHLQPEILIVDEVLAVGDAEFQKKCLGKMSEVAAQGRTVLFVSHNLGAILQMCRRAVMLERGMVRQIGPANEVVKSYLLQHARSTDTVDLIRFPNRSGNGAVRFESARLLNGAGEVSSEFSIGDEMRLEFQIRKHRPVGKLTFAAPLATSEGLKLAHIVDADSGFSVRPFDETLLVSICFRDLRFYPGAYQFSLFVGSLRGEDTYDFVQDCLTFEIVGGGQLTTRPLPRSSGLLFLTPDWESCEPH